MDAGGGRAHPRRDGREAGPRPRRGHRRDGGGGGRHDAAPRLPRRQGARSGAPRPRPHAPLRAGAARGPGARDRRDLGAVDAEVGKVAARKPHQLVVGLAVLPPGPVGGDQSVAHGFALSVRPSAARQ